MDKPSGAWAALCAWWVLALVGPGAGAGAEAPARAQWLAAGASFACESTLLVNEAARRDREVGYKLRALLRLRPLHARQGHSLLHFQLSSPKLHLRGKHPNAEFEPHPSVWDQHSESSFYAHLDKGNIVAAYLDPQDPPDILNYKRAILSLFQFQLADGLYNETDISGNCEVLYETVEANTFRKIKKRCEGDAPPAEVRRVTRFTLAGGGLGGLGAVHAEEVVRVGPAGDPRRDPHGPHGPLGLKARSWHSLTALPAPPAPPPPPSPPSPAADSLPSALAALPAHVAALPLPLPLPSPRTDADQDLGFEDDQELAAVVEAHRSQLSQEEAGGGGTAAAAAAALALVAALRAAPAAAISALLREPSNHGIVGGLCRALGLTGSAHALAALDSLVALRGGGAPEALAALYLDAFALSAQPEAGAVAAVLRVPEAAPYAANALLSAAAAAARRADLGDDSSSSAVRDHITRSLARCKDEECASLRLRALANLRRADTAEALLEHALRGAEAPAAALAALDALSALPPRALSYAHAERVAALALDERPPLEVRAAALELAVGRWARVATPLARTARALHERAPHELRRLFWQRLRVLAPHHEAVRHLLAGLRPELRSWHALALAGTSSVLRRATGWHAGGWRAILDSVQVAQGGLLRRGTVSLEARSLHNVTEQLLSVEVWTRGMEAFAAGEGSAEAGAGADAEAEAGAGLAFAVGGVRMRGVRLFSGQAELLGHVWAGTGSAPTPALRALVPLASGAVRLPLAAGVALLAEWRAAAALAVDAHATVSLWYRTARSALQLRAALAAEARLRVRTAWGELSASARASLEPRLRIGADLDFYEGVALCVRAHCADAWARRNVSLASRQGARAHQVRRTRLASLRAAGRTLALGARNDVACRTLRAADADADMDMDTDTDTATGASG